MIETHQHQTVSLLIYIKEKWRETPGEFQYFARALQIPGYPKSDHQKCVPKYGYLMISSYIPYVSRFGTPHIPETTA